MTTASELADQYTDGQAADAWDEYIGNIETRTTQYKDRLLNILRTHGCQTVLDAACGTGVDSILLVEAGFNVTSIDYSDKMLKHALRKRWENRSDVRYDRWVIEEGNWLTLHDSLKKVTPEEGGWDAIICLGNSFTHLPDSKGDGYYHKLALSNMRDALNPGGLLLIDNRNYDAILDNKKTAGNNIYYNISGKTQTRTTLTYTDGRPVKFALDFTIPKPKDSINNDGKENQETFYTFRLSGFPHRVSSFTSLLCDVFGDSSKHTVYGDFEIYDGKTTPGYFIHQIVKQNHLRATYIG